MGGMCGAIKVLCMLVVIFSLNAIACAGLFMGKRQIVIVALGRGQP